MRHRSRKRSEHELKGLVERAVTEVCGLDGSRLAFHVQAVETSGDPLSAIKVWSVLHFLAAGSPYCCGEPGCHLGLYGASGREVSARVRRAMRLEQALEIDFGDRVAVQYHDGVEFRRGAD